jgi:DNA repair protein RecO (recombination protein O)
MIAKTEAVVLKSMRYRDTSKIVTFYTREFGKITGIAKGARAPKNKYGASLEPMTYVSLLFYKKENRELHLISQCEIIRLFTHLHSDLEKITVGLGMVELVNSAMHSEERNERVFRLLVDAICELDRATKNLRNVFYHFRLHLLGYMGFKPNFDTCTRCGRRLGLQGKEVERFHFDPRGGGFLCRECAGLHPQKIRVTAETVNALKEMSHVSLSEATTFEVPKVSKREIDAVFNAYENHHLVGKVELKSEVVARSLVKL